MLPRRCLPSWLGWQLHVNDGSLVGAGLAVAPLASLARALPGGPARVLPWRAVVPDKDLAGTACPTPTEHATLEPKVSNNHIGTKAQEAPP